MLEDQAGRNEAPTGAARKTTSPNGRRWLVAASLLAGGLAASASAAEWALWRGADHDGVSAATGLVESWSPEGENLLWSVPFVGRSTPVVADGQACVIGRTGEGIDRGEIVACYDAATGRKRWEHRFEVYNTTVPFNRVGWASLAADVETGNVYAHGVGGQLIAYDRDGAILWSHALEERFGRASGYGGRTQTPIVEGDLLLLSFVSLGWGEHAAPRHRLFAFDKHTGEVVWVSTPGVMVKDMNTQSVPVVADLGGQRLVVYGNADGWVYAVRLDDGAKVWSFHLSKRGLNSSVLVRDDVVYAAHSEENVDEPTMGRVVAIDGTGSGDVTATHELWRADELAVGFASPTLHDGRLYVVDNSANLYALDAATGATLWEHSLGTVGKGSPVWADGKLYVGEVNGRFHILALGADAARPLDVDELTVASGRYAELYGSPAIAYGRVFFTTEGGLYALGDPTAVPDVPARSWPRPRRALDTGAAGEATALHVVPGDLILAPGELAPLGVRLLDARARRLPAPRVTWTLDGLRGRIETDGRLRPDPTVPFQTGAVVARYTADGGRAFAARARVRVLAPLPWQLDFSAGELGATPPSWIGARGKFEIAEHEGERVLVQPPRERGLQRSYTYVGRPDTGGVTVQVDGKGTQMRRRKSDVGVINGGYILDLQGNHQRLQIRSWTSELRMADEVDYAWEMDRWYTLRLRVDQLERMALVRGKVWPRDAPEPEGWTLVVEDPHPIRRGSPGLIGYAPAEVYYDNLIVTEND